MEETTINARAVLAPWVGVTFGKFSPREANVFAHDETRQFMNSAFVFNPAAATTVPLSFMGAGLILIPHEDVVLTTLVLDSEGDANAAGCDTAFDRGTSVYQMAEVKVRPFGLEGHQRVSWTWSDNVRTALDQNLRLLARQLIRFRLGLGPAPVLATKDSDWAFFYDFDQYVYRVPDAKDCGVGVFGRFGWTDGDVNPVESFYSAGVGAKGLIPGREEDTCGVAYYYTAISDQLPRLIRNRLDDEQGVEVYYNIAVTPLAAHHARHPDHQPGAATQRHDRRRGHPDGDAVLAARAGPVGKRASKKGKDGMGKRRWRRLVSALAVTVGSGLVTAAAAADPLPQPPTEVSLVFAEADAMEPATGGGAAPGTAGPAAPGGGPSATDLAKKTQNPISDLISVPFQYNANFNVGASDRTMHLLNIQPVVPIALNKDLNLILRTIMPVTWLPEVAPGVGPQAGLGDIQLSAFLSPADSGKVIWGAGPVFQFASATDELLGAEKYSAGPSLVVLTMDGPWVAGALVQNVWSYAGAGGREDVNAFLLQPFLNYNLPGGWYLTSSPIITANWRADQEDRWTVPVGGGMGRVTRIGKLPVNISLAAFYNVMRPDAGPDWSVRFQVALLFPK
jgi:hypothetical protein